MPPVTASTETTALRILQWASLGSLALAIAAVVLDLPLGEIAAPWLFVIAVGTYISYTVIDIRRRRRLRAEQQG